MYRINPKNSIKILFILIYFSSNIIPFHLKYALSVLLSFLFFNCGQDTPTMAEAECFQLPKGTHLPRLFLTPENIQLSYVLSEQEQHNLLAFPIPPSENSTQTTVFQSGKEWFVNWADFPSIKYVDEGLHGHVFFSHALEYSAGGTYDYDIKYSFRDDNGPLFIPRKLHQDTVSAEHGFLSSAQLPEGGLQVSWLDGRYTKQAGADAGAKKVAEQSDDHGHGAGGAMTLRTKALTDSVSVELDHRVCDCCNTATVATDDLVMVAYRDRSEHEIRDIGYVIKRTGTDEWSTPRLVHADNWEINGCPVNGPALAANGAGNIAIVWYTAPADRAQILFSRYDAALDAWQPPTLLDDNAPLGRVDLQLAEDGTAYATALTTRENIDDAFLTLWAIAPSGEVEREDLVSTSPARSSGFPKIALFEDKLYWARTVVGEEKGQHHVEVCWR